CAEIPGRYRDRTSLRRGHRRGPRSSGSPATCRNRWTMLWSRPSVPRAVEAGWLAVTVLTVPLFAFFTVLTVLVLADGPPGASLLADHPDTRPSWPDPSPARRPAIGAGHRGGTGAAGSLAPAGPRGRRGHLRQARADAVHAAGSASAGVHQRTEPASGRRVQGAVAGHQRGAGSLARRAGDREVRQLRHRA